MKLFSCEGIAQWKRELIHLLIKHEGMRSRPYLDTTGNLTIGVGRNLTANGISDKEAAEMLWNDIEKALDAANNAFSWIKTLDKTRKNVIYSMVFNMGIGGVRSFKKMISALENEDWGLAAAEMLDSKWAKQVGSRAIELSEMMRHGD